MHAPEDKRHGREEPGVQGCHIGKGADHGVSLPRMGQ